MTAIELFLHRFPQLQKLPFYISGHGYASVYITNLAQAIIKNNKDPLVIFNLKINLKGILLGNPCVKPG